MNRQVIVLSGCSGSGKTHFANRLVGEENPNSGRIVSATDFFTDEHGNFTFDKNRLRQAHNACFAIFIAYLQEGFGLVIVDNTNTTTEEIAPYMLGAGAFGYEAELVSIICDSDDVEYAIGRNIHNVPEETVRRQNKQVRTRRIPPW